MRPLHELLNRIRWDRDFGKARFTLGYYDRVEDRILDVALKEMRFDHPNDTEFEMVNEEGNAVRIPFHRVRRVTRDGEVIWSRDSWVIAGERR